MSARDELHEAICGDGCGPPRRCERTDRRIDAHDAEVRREWAAKIREVGTAKGWSVWAAAFLDPDVPFVDTGMPSTETIVAELRRLDRDAVLREVDERLAAMELPEYLKGTFNAGSYADAWRHCRATVAAMVTDADREKDTGGRLLADGESTPDFFQAEQAYERGRWRFQCLAVSRRPWDGELHAVGFLTSSNGSGSVAGLGPDDWRQGGWRGICTPPHDTGVPMSHSTETARDMAHDTDTEGPSQ